MHGLFVQAEITGGDRRRSKATRKQNNVVIQDRKAHRSSLQGHPRRMARGDAFTGNTKNTKAIGEIK